MAGAVLAAAGGHGPIATVLALWAVVSLYGSVDHAVEPALAELLELDEAMVRSDVRQILAVFAVDDQEQAVLAAAAAGGARSAA